MDITKSMNKIESKIDKSDYENYPDFLNILIDNIWLDELLQNCKPEVIKGTIPTLCFGMEDRREEEVVWQRFLPKTGETTICPILMCPDDNDFYCICIVAEIHNNGQTIIWKRIGDDASDVIDAKNVGTTVNWFQNFKSLEFSISEYSTVMANFKKQHGLYRVDYEIRNKLLAEEQKLNTNNSATNKYCGGRKYFGFKAALLLAPKRYR